MKQQKLFINNKAMQHMRNAVNHWLSKGKGEIEAEGDNFITFWSEYPGETAERFTLTYLPNINEYELTVMRTRNWWPANEFENTFDKEVMA